MKSVMALHHRPSLQVPISRRQILRWIGPTFRSSYRPHPRMAPSSVASTPCRCPFGFGGTNFHIALEGYEPDYHGPMASDWDARWATYSGQATASAPSIFDGSLPATMSHEALKAVEGASASFRHEP